MDAQRSAEIYSKANNTPAGEPAVSVFARALIDPLTNLPIVKVGAGGLFEITGGIKVPKTVSTTGGDQTINQPAGSVIFEMGAPITITNNLVTADSIILITIATVDQDMKGAVVVAGAGSFVITPVVEPAAPVRVNFLVIN